MVSTLPELYPYYFELISSIQILPLFGTTLMAHNALFSFLVFKNSFFVSFILFYLKAGISSFL